MNEVDKKAFEGWVNPACSEKDAEDDPWHVGQYRLGAEQAWRAACEHKQREIDALKARVARLEDALQEYVDAHAHLAGVSDRVEQKAEALREAANELEAGISSSLRLTIRGASALRTYAELILQEAKEQ